MTQVIQKLTDEHDRIRSVLLCFETQLDRFERAQRPDYEILCASVKYCQEHLDCWHRLREDALLEVMLHRAPAEARTRAFLEHQCCHLIRTSREVVKIFEAVERDVEYPRAPFVEKGRALVADCRRHFDWEETSFLPALTDNLLPEDWREIAPRFDDTMEPHSRRLLDERYLTLFSAIDEP